MSEERARFYIAEIILAMKDLHSRNIIYRDLKPDNVVICNDGHISLIDFGMAKTEISEVQRGAKTFCGSVMYLAPEMLKKVGHGQALDWYLLGVLLYEMLVGQTPYFSTNKDQLFNNILYGKLKLPKSISGEVRSLLIALLSRNPSKRLGSTPGEQGAMEIMRHPFFEGIDWHALYNREYFQSAGYWPEPPKYTIEDYQDAFPDSQLSNQQISKLYSGEDTDEEIEQEALEIEQQLGLHDDDQGDGGSGGPGGQADAPGQVRDAIVSQESRRQKEKQRAEIRKRAVAEHHRKATLYYKYVDGWDFSRPSSDLGSIEEADFGGLNPANDLLYPEVKKDEKAAEQSRPRLLEQLHEIERSSSQRGSH